MSIESCLPAIFLISFIAAAPAQTGFNQATVTRVQNVVNYGQVAGGRSTKRPAVVSDVVRESNFLLSEADSRAELRYEDGSVVRIGQNTVFSFDADTRTLTLEKGTLVFSIPKGSGGGQIKTRSLTAAITGTIGKVSDNTIAIIQGEVVLQPSGRRVGEGQFARRNADGTITIAPFDPATALDGKLMTFNGALPGIKEVVFDAPKFTMPDLSIFDTLERTQNHPAALQQFNPAPVRIGEEREEGIEVITTPPPRPRVVPTPIPGTGGGGNGGGGNGGGGNGGGGTGGPKE